MEKNISRTKRRSGKWIWLLILILVLALVIAYFFRSSFGLGSGSGNPLKPDTSVTNPQDPAGSKSQKISLSVKADRIFLQGQSLTLEEVESKLGQLDPETTSLELIDDGATLGTYEAVEAILVKSGHPFTKVDNIQK